MCPQQRRLRVQVQVRVRVQVRVQVRVRVQVQKFGPAQWRTSPSHPATAPPAPHGVRRWSGGGL